MALDIPTIRKLVDTVVIVMLENRSFDHMLGYLQMPPYRRNVDGLRDDPKWLQSVANTDAKTGFSYPPFHLKYFWIPDMPHERLNIELQLGGKKPDGTFPLDGFIDSASGDSSVMGFNDAADAPITAYFAEQFRVCNRWFASLPAGTQPNRLMALSGFSLIDKNRPILLEDQKPLVYDWLTEREIPWRVYHEGIFPFISLMERWWEPIAVGENFLPLGRLYVDFAHEPKDTFPKVIFVEPTYTCAHIGQGTDDHSPTPITFAQHFLLQVFQAVTANPERWAKTVMILTYDEHGGFFDHVQPIPLETVAPNDAYPVFETSGLRVPGIVISPLVSPGSVYTENLDHTSILKFLGQMFDEKESYSAEVDKRNVHSVAEVLDLSAAETHRGAPPNDAVIPSPAGVPIAPVKQPLAYAFQAAAAGMKQDHAHPLAAKHFHAPQTLGSIGIKATPKA